MGTYAGARAACAVISSVAAARAALAGALAAAEQGLTENERCVLFWVGHALSCCVDSQKIETCWMGALQAAYVWDVPVGPRAVMLWQLVCGCFRHLVPA
mmetsp:Transcript_2041/g.5197  ORF Transcript_2041/g.5197 Transcript_2041/m.5197 type:complete len:99 (+) Transcript_2041:1232-1528(+)